MRILPTIAGQELEVFDPVIPAQQGTGSPRQYIDVSAEPSEEQYNFLVAMLEADDAANPAPFTGTPPWGEPIHPAEVIPDSVIEHNILVPADLDYPPDADPLVRIRDPFPNEIPAPEWYNDDQYFGLGVNPGVENVQPFETGHTQIVPLDPAAEAGWDAWSGRPARARVARMENNFPGYSADVNRKLGQHAVEKIWSPYVLRTQQARDLMLVELNRRGVHNVVVADVPAMTFTESVVAVDPTLVTNEVDIGPEGYIE